MRPRVLVPVRGGRITGGPATFERALLSRLPAAAPDWHFVYLVHRHDPSAARWIDTLDPRPLVIRTDVPPGLLWDHVLVPTIARRLGAHLVFSAFSALPAWGDFARVAVIPGGDYFVRPQVLDRRQRFKWRVFRHLLPRADRLVCMSETHRRDVLAATGLPAERVAAIHPGVDPHFRPMDAGEARRRIATRLGLEGPYLLFVGHLFPNKNLEAVLHALRLLDDLPHRLVVAGGTRWHHRPTLALADRLGVGDRLVRPGPLDAEDLVPLYAAAEALLFPSFYESFGFAMVEAMACGCPVIASHAGALPEVGGDAFLPVDPAKPPTVAQAVRRLLHDPALRNRLVSAGLARARRYRWAHCVRQMVAVLAEALAARAARSATQPAATQQTVQQTGPAGARQLVEPVGFAGDDGARGP